MAVASFDFDGLDVLTCPVQWIEIVAGMNESHKAIGKMHHLSIGILRGSGCLLADHQVTRVGHVVIYIVARVGDSLQAGGTSPRPRSCGGRLLVCEHPLEVESSNLEMLQTGVWQFGLTRWTLRCGACILTS